MWMPLWFRRSTMIDPIKKWGDLASASCCGTLAVYHRIRGLKLIALH